MKADVAIIGGGMAGLSAAQSFSKKGKKVVLLEQYYCGSGASGKSSGFITPNAELSLTDFAHRYSNNIAKKIWNLFIDGVHHIRNNIQEYRLNCDYISQDVLVVANSKKAFKKVKTESEELAQLGYDTSLYDADVVNTYIKSPYYYGAVRYGDSFGIHAYLYCQEMKSVLQKEGVEIFEETPVTSIDNHTLKTLHADITADIIVVCADRFAPNLGLLSKKVYHVQTFLMVSQELTDKQIRTIFPNKRYMVWDTDLIYTYFRITGDNRLLLGGGNVWTTYAAQPDHHYKPIVKQLTTYLNKKFPGISVQFEQLWPGLIGISKDIGPIAGCDKEKPYLYYVSAAAGLPIAAALGQYSAEHMLEGRTDLDAYFSPYRPFPIGGVLQTLLGTKLSFALSNVLKKGS